MKVIAIAAKSLPGGALCVVGLAANDVIRAMSIRGTHRPFFSPVPFDGIDFKTPDFLGFPGDHLPSIWKRDKVLGAKRYGAVTTPFNQDRALAASILGEDDPHSQSFSTMTNLALRLNSPYVKIS